MARLKHRLIKVTSSRTHCRKVVKSEFEHRLPGSRAVLFIIIQNAWRYALFSLISYTEDSFDYIPL